MSREFKVSGFAYSERFKTEMQDASPDIHRAALNALELLQANPKAKSLRLHNLTGYPKPTIWKIDVFVNRSWQITFELVGEVAHLKRISTHRSIDRAPR